MSKVTVTKDDGAKYLIIVVSWERWCQVRKPKGLKRAENENGIYREVGKGRQGGVMWVQGRCSACAKGKTMCACSVGMVPTDTTESP